MAVKLGNGNWAVKEDKLLAYNDNSGLFFNKEFDFSRGSTATYVGRDGLIASAASGVPRIDFTNDTKGHLLLEPSRTNIITNSSDFFTGSWVGTRVTEGSTIVSPDGSDTAHKLVPNTATNTHYRQFVYSSASAGSYTASAFFKKDEYNVGVIRIDADTGTNRIGVAINLTDGTFISQNTKGSPTGTSYKIEDYSNGWYRLSVTIIHTSGNVQTNFSIAPDTFNWSNGLPTFTGDGLSGAYSWGAQLESGDYSTSLIPTTGTTSTRNADVCNNSGSAQDFNSEEGVLYVEIASLDGDESSRFLSVSNSQSDEFVRFIFASSNQLKANMNTQSGSQFTKTMIVDRNGEFLKAAIQYKSNDYKVYLNGVSQSVPQNPNTPSGLNQLAFNRGGCCNVFYGKVRNVQVFTEALTDEQLEKLTS